LALIRPSPRGQNDVMTTLHTHTDHQIQTAIVKELDWSPEVRSEHIGVSVNDGAVMLSGEVNSFPEKEAAVRCGLRVRGVIAVADEVVVRRDDVATNDADLARSARASIAQCVALRDQNITASVHDGVVTLTGIVDWHHQRTTAHTVVSSLSGVRGVVDRLTIKPRATSAQTKSKITAALHRSAQVEAQDIDVDVEDHTARLSGTVRSWAEAHESVMAAWSAPGITHVDNHLRVIG
jgi:osmotically-inducible protein OsmY